MDSEQDALTGDQRRELVEGKERYDGSRQEFACECLASAAGRLVLLFRLPAGASFATLDLPPGSVSLGYFWEDRPYNVYHWLRPDGTTAGWYINVSDRTSITAAGVTWRDLILDVLAIPGQPVRVLDEDELPPDFDPALRRYVTAAVDDLLATLPSLTEALERQSVGYWATLTVRESHIG